MSEQCVYEIYDTSSSSSGLFSSSSVPRSITPVVFTAGWVGGGGGTLCLCVRRSLHPPPGIRQTLINWEECKQAGAAAETQDGGGWGVGREEGGRMWGWRKGKEKKEKTPSPPPPPKLLVNSPPRRSIQNVPEQWGSGSRRGPEQKISPL